MFDDNDESENGLPENLPIIRRDGKPLKLNNQYPPVL
jgi:hypothetical protein